MAKTLHMCIIYLVVSTLKCELITHIVAWTGQNITLKCPTHGGLWRRQLGLSSDSTVYADYSNVNPYLPHRNRLNSTFDHNKNVSSLYIYNVIPDDSGVYICITVNISGTFYTNITLNVSELKEEVTATETTAISKSFPVKILYLCGGILGAVVLIVFCAAILSLVISKYKKTTEAPLNVNHATSSNTDLQENPYDEIDEEITSTVKATKISDPISPSSYLNVLNRDSLQSANTYGVTDDDVVTSGLSIPILSDSGSKVGAEGGLQVNEYHMYEEVSNELTQVNHFQFNSSIKQSEYYSNNQGNVNSRMTNEIYRNTYQALQPNWQMPPKLYSRLTLNNV